MYYDSSITIMWSPSLVISDFTLPCWQVKKQFGQVIRVRPVGLHSLKVLQLSFDADRHPILQYYEIIQRNGKSQQQNLT